jgi:hypothetical protein
MTIIAATGAAPAAGTLDFKVNDKTAVGYGDVIGLLEELEIQKEDISVEITYARGSPKNVVLGESDASAGYAKSVLMEKMYPCQNTYCEGVHTVRRKGRRIEHCVLLEYGLCICDTPVSDAEKNEPFQWVKLRYLI